MNVKLRAIFALCLLSKYCRVYVKCSVISQDASFVQRFVDKHQLCTWISKRAPAIQHVQLDFDAWCRQYYQGAFSAVQAGASVAALLKLVQGSLQELKVQDTSFVVNAPMLHSLAAATNLQHLQLFGISSHILVSDTLGVVMQLSQLQTWNWQTATSTGLQFSSSIRISSQLKSATCQTLSHSTSSPLW